MLNRSAAGNQRLYRVPRHLRKAKASGHAMPVDSPRLYAPRSSFDRWASIRRTSRRWPFTRAIFIES